MSYSQDPDKDQDPDPQESDAQESKDREFDNFVNLMYRKLPQELVDNVEYWLYETAFCSGYLYPHRRQKKHSLCCPWPKEVDIVARPALLGLSKAIKAKYETRMWSENIWVINAGEAQDSLGFIVQLPIEAEKKYIRKLHLHFTICGLDRLWSRSQPQPHGDARCVKRLHPRSLEFAPSWASDLQQVWGRTLAIVSPLPLRLLILDFTDCDIGEVYWEAGIAKFAEIISNLAQSMEVPDFRVLEPPQDHCTEASAAMSFHGLLPRVKCGLDYLARSFWSRQ